VAGIHARWGPAGHPYPPPQLRVDPLYSGSPKQQGARVGGEYPGQVPGRYSDPGVNWAQQYQGLQGESRRINEQYGEPF